LGVTWQKPPPKKVFSTRVFIQSTLQEISEESFRELSGRSVAEADAPEGVEKDLVVIEKWLEDFIVKNFDTIFEREGLTIYKDDDGRNGQQYPTETGPIDILAVEPKSKSFVIIELKTGRSSDRVVGQILRYMGWVKEELCKDGRAVRGLIICGEPDTKLSYALKMTKDIDVRYYDLSFKFKEAP
jgi:restriction system protein